MIGKYLTMLHQRREKTLKDPVHTHGPDVMWSLLTPDTRKRMRRMSEGVSDTSDWNAGIVPHPTGQSWGDEIQRIEPSRGQMNAGSYHFPHRSIFTPFCRHLQLGPTLETRQTDLKHSCSLQHFSSIHSRAQVYFRHSSQLYFGQDVQGLARHAALSKIQAWSQLF